MEQLQLVLLRLAEALDDQAGIQADRLDVRGFLEIQDRCRGKETGLGIEKKVQLQVLQFVDARLR